MGLVEGAGLVEKLSVTDKEYEGLEEDSIRSLREFLSSDGGDPALLAKAKVAQGSLGSVQSHFKTAYARRSLDFEMARSLTNDPGNLAEYIKMTAPSGAVRSLAAKVESKAKA